MSDEIQYDPRIAAMYKADGGWQNIPGGKKGGKRRRKGSGWEYRYDDAPSGSASAQPSDRSDGVIGHTRSGKPIHAPRKTKTRGYTNHPRHKGAMRWASDEDHADSIDAHMSAYREAYRQFRASGNKDRDAQARGDAHFYAASNHHVALHGSRGLGEKPSSKRKVSKAEDPMGSNPLDLVNANPAIPSSMRQGSVTYAVAAAHEPAPERSIPSLRAPARPAYEQAEREVLDLVNDLPRVNGVLTHPNGVDRRD